MLTGRGLVVLVMLCCRLPMLQRILMLMFQLSYLSIIKLSITVLLTVKYTWPNFQFQFTYPSGTKVVTLITLVSTCKCVCNVYEISD